MQCGTQGGAAWGPEWSSVGPRVLGQWEAQGGARSVGPRMGQGRTAQVPEDVGKCGTQGGAVWDLE